MGDNMASSHQRNETISVVDRNNGTYASNTPLTRTCDQLCPFDNEQLQALLEANRSLLTITTPDTLPQIIVMRTAALVSVRHVFLYLLDNAKNVMRMQAALGCFEICGQEPMIKGEGLVGKTWDQNRVVVTGDNSLFPTSYIPPSLPLLASVIAVPLTTGTEVTGVMGVGFDDNVPDTLDCTISLLTLFTETVSITLENAQTLAATQQRLNEQTKSANKLLKLSQAIMQCPVSVIITDLHGTIEFANPFVARLTGYEPDELMGNTPRIFKSGLTSASTYTNLWQTILAGGEWRGELQNRKKNGQIYWERVLISPIKDQHGIISHFIAIKEDIGDLKIMENQLRHSQKMEAIGQLAGGIAHDFNNILTAIIGYSNILMMKSPDNSTFRGTAEQILASAERGAKLTQGLLTFSRKHASTLLQIDLNTVIDRVEKLLLSLIGNDITLETQQASQPLMVMADTMQIEQVLINLTTNMRDAMPEGGAISIRTAPIVLNAEFSEICTSGNGTHYALLAVSDTGHGMDEETTKRIFDPFYTTKETGKGSGLGLSIVYGIIKKHNGHITCDSTLGQGTNFKIYLPIHKDTDQGPTPVTGESPKTLNHVSTTLLLVSNDHDSRNDTKNMLVEFGYTILDTDSTEIAVQQYRESYKAIQAVIVDGISSGPQGIRLFKELKSAIPLSRVILCGDSQDTIIRQFTALEHELIFLAKPFAPKTLLMKIKEVVKDAR